MIKDMKGVLAMEYEVKCNMADGKVLTVTLYADSNSEVVTMMKGYLLGKGDPVLKGKTAEGAVEYLNVQRINTFTFEKL